jgi:DNA recombination-dependent growth factor C
VDDVAGQFDVDFTIMTAELSQFVTALMSAMGGETDSAHQ